MLREPGEDYPEYCQRLVAGWDRNLRFDAPREELARFEPERAGLVAVSPAEARRYIREHSDERPWLKPVEDAWPEVQRVFAAGDLAGVHGHIRHDGWVSEKANMYRVAHLEDPAERNLDKRRRGIDGLLPDDVLHQCSKLATRITDPAAYATATVRGTEHPGVRAELNSRLHAADTYPWAVELPIADLIGADGHRFCTGWILDQGTGSMTKARNNRLDWQDAMFNGREPSGPRPAARPIPTFEGGTLAFVIDYNPDTDRCALLTVTAQPPKDALLPPQRRR